MKKNFFVGVITMSLFTMFLSGCNTNSSDTEQNTTQSKMVNSTSEKRNEKVYAKNIGFQLEMPEINEEIAVMDIADYGKIYIRFFPEECPKTVENFKTLAQKGYYNGTIFHRVIENFIIQGGDPNGDGTGGESTFGGSFEDEFCDYLFNITGAISMANRGPATNGSQFFINNVDPADDVYNGTSSDEKIVELYKKNGGNSHLDGHHTVFGQVFAGMDVVDKISKTKVDEENDKPIKQVVVNLVDIKKFDGKTE